MKTTITLALSLICYAAFSQANKTLSNLTSPTAINTHLLPGTTSTFNLGSGTKKWKNGYFTGTLYAKNLKVNNTGGDAVLATSTNNYGINATSTNSWGVYGAGTNYGGVYGTGPTYGVYGSSSSYGVFGSGYYGVLGSGTYGTYGSGSSYGVYGYGPTGVYGTASTTGSGTYGGYFYHAGGRAVYGYDAGSGNGVFGYETGSGEGIRGEAYGSAGYGCEGYSLHSLGVIGITGNSSSYAGYFSGNVYTTGSYLPSDESLKQNVEDFTSAMKVINQLHPKQYQYRQDGNYKMMNLPQGQRYGLLAQDVEKVLPGLVKVTTFDVGKAAPLGSELSDPKNPSSAKIAAQRPSGLIEFKAVNYTELIPVMVKALQEQDARIAAQDAKIEALTQQINTLLKNVNGGAISLNEAILDQNVPNPNNGSTRIGYNVPSTSAKAQIVVYDNTGKQLKAIALTNTGKGFINLNTTQLASGTYTYSLIVNGREIDSKKMVVTK